MNIIIDAPVTSRVLDNEALIKEETHITAKVLDNDKLISNINKKNLSKTTYSNSIYNNLFYCDNENKICISFTPRGGCSISFQQYLDLVGLLKDGLDYNPFIHFYRNVIFEPNIKVININKLIKQFTFVKFIMNPYIRTVSIFRAQTSHNLSFRQYLNQLINNKIDYFNENDKYHFHQQYIPDAPVTSRVLDNEALIKKETHITAKVLDNDKLISNINKKNLSKTTYSNSIYNNLFYCDNENKICISFTPRGGCSISFQQYLDLVGLLKDGLDYNPFIHFYRNVIFEPNIKVININKLIKQFTFVKFIMNPYIRTVSIFRAQTSHNLSFRQYLNQLINNKIDYFNENDKYHFHQQYIPDEEKIITKYIKIDKNETFEIKLSNGKLYNLDVNKYTSCHHGIKTDNTIFCGDLLKDDVNNNLPKSYKYFYDEEIKQMVDTYYKQDIEHYGYNFDDNF